VTGAATGIGAAAARLLKNQGATVVLADLNEAGVKSVAMDIDAMWLGLDVTVPDSWSAARAAAEAEFGHVDILVNNAGVALPTPIVSATWDTYLKVVGVNQHGTFLGMQTFVPAMVAAGRGAVINVASVDSTRGTPGMAAYCASKHAVLGMTRAIALELASTGVRLNCVCPGIVATEMTLALRPTLLDPEDTTLRDMIPAGRAADPTEVADLIVYLASDRAAYCTGSHFVIDGGWTAGLMMPPALRPGMEH
jgi:3alpha(or 20beta)-hydroxysteroid dehydrogenase